MRPDLQSRLVLRRRRKRRALRVDREAIRGGPARGVDDLKFLKDLNREKDRIGLPSVKVSVPAIYLQMAAEQLYGRGKHEALDVYTQYVARLQAVGRRPGLAQQRQGDCLLALFRRFQHREPERVHCRLQGSGD